MTAQPTTLGAFSVRRTGPASFVLADPDGNTILVDPHVPTRG